MLNTREATIGPKSSDRQAFDRWLRTGRRTDVERKFNPWHDPRNGRFTFAPGGPRSLADAMFSDRRGLWRAKPRTVSAARSTSGESAFVIANARVDPAALWDDERPELQPTQSGPNSRARIGGNRPPSDPLILEQVFPTLRSAPAGTIIAPLDSFFDFTGPARALTTEIHRVQVERLTSQIRSIDPGYQYRSAGPQQPTIESMANQIRTLRLDRAVVFYRHRGETRPLQVEVLRIMQERADSAYNEAVARYNAGRLNVRLSREEAIGNFIDAAVRHELRQRFNFHRIDYAAGNPVRVVGREYDSSGTERTFRVPDARVGNIAFDVTLTRKTHATRQVQGFFRSDFEPTAVVIVRPSQLGRGNTYALTRPKR